MTEQTQIQGLNRKIRAPERARKHANVQVPLSTYMMQGAGGMGFMMFIFWLAGFGS
jgi:hypothetical protein